MLIARQPGFSRFLHDFYDGADNMVGSIRWPDVAVATNARLKGLYPGFLSKDIVIQYGNQSFQIEFEYLNRKFINDIEFRLKNDGETLASCAVIQPKGLFSRLPPMQIKGQFEGELISKSKLLSVRYEVTCGGVVVGHVFEKPGFSLKRELFIDLPNSVPYPIQFFIFFLVCNRSFR